jgi:hypothetical protein
MKTFFGAHDLMEIVHRELKKNDYKALFYIRQGVNGSNLEKISKITKAKEAWQFLRSTMKVMRK